MSYILDALKRAESERERGVVPGLLSQSVPLLQPAVGPRVAALPLGVAGAAVVLALLGVLAWHGLGPVATAVQTPAAAVSPPVTSQVLVAVPVVTSQAAPTAMPVPVQPAQPDKPAASPRPEPRQEPRPEPKPPAIAAAAAPPITPLSELTAEVRNALPKVVISGSTYSDNPAYRMLIINGEVFREGDKPAPDLQLEQIRAKAAVLNFKGLRYSVAY